MLLLLDTTTGLAKLQLVDQDSLQEFEWQADRQLARGLLTWIEESVKNERVSLGAIKGIGVRRGPGSFTGIRIGLTVLNTLADSYKIPIVGTEGDEWSKQAIERLNVGQNDTLVLPLYDRDAHITMPRK